MQLIYRGLGFSLLVASTAACGPDAPAQEMPELSTWMLGTWSDRGIGELTNECGINQLKFQEDGTVMKGSASCGARPSFPTELTWERDGEDAIIVHLPDGGHPDAWRVSPGTHPITLEVKCDWLDVANIVNDEVFPKVQGLYVRGSVCMKVLSGCPEGQGNCESYKTVWCDEPPPPCEEANAQ